MKTKTLKGRGCEAVAYCRDCFFQADIKSKDHRIDALRRQAISHSRKTGHNVEIHKTNWTLIKQIPE